MPLTWQLQIDDYSPGGAGFGIEGGKATEIYQSSEYASPADILVMITEILGDVVRGTALSNHNNKLNRKLPLAHPLYPWLIASRVELQGFGVTDTDGSKGRAELPPIRFLEAPLLLPLNGRHWQYPRTQLTVTFEPRPYAILSDSDTHAVPLQWRNSAGTLITTDWDSQEWLRFTDVELDPNPQVVHAEQGQLRYIDSGMPLGGGPFLGHPWMTMPDGQLKVIWYQVPYSLFLDSNHPMHILVGRINQTVFMGWPIGSLVYTGAKARRYTPVKPSTEPLPFGGGVLSTEKLCDVTFMFDSTVRVAPAGVPTPTNPNWLTMGWNLQPWWVDRKFHYVAANKSASAEQIPVYLSAPMQLLFTVPDTIPPATGAYNTTI